MLPIPCPCFNLPRWAGGIALLAALALAAPVAAQQTGTVTGQITDAQTQRPLTGAQVSVPGTGVGSLSGTDG
ncbi:MAG: hypothetical protein EA422_12390, partial [Gemmatimonadales bacterium]